MHRIEVNLMARPAADSNAVSAKRRAECTCAGGLIVPDIKHEIVFDDVIVTTRQIDSLGWPGLGIVVSDAADLVFLHCIGACRADGADRDAGGWATATGGNPTFYVDDVAANHANQPRRGAGTLRRNADRINLVNGPRGWVADQVVFDEQIWKHGSSSALNGYAAGGRYDVVVLDGQIICRRSAANSRGDGSDCKRRGPGRGGRPAAGQDAVSRIFRSRSGYCRADVSARRATDKIEVLNRVVISLIVAGGSQSNADYLTKCGDVGGRIYNREVSMRSRCIWVIAIDGHVARAIELNYTEAADWIAIDRHAIVYWTN